MGAMMTQQAKITSKGQITVPLRVRRALGVKPGDRIVFDLGGAEVVVRPIRAENPFEKYRGAGGTGIASGRKAVIDTFREMRGYEDIDAE
jgi:AbrB family looped-hinge helix DNA binding protein